MADAARAGFLIGGPAGIQGACLIDPPDGIAERSERDIADAALQRHQEMSAAYESEAHDPARNPFVPTETEARRHHYIPRFWLVGLASRRVVSVVDMSGGSPTTQLNIRRAATEESFYTLPGIDGSPTNILESMLSFVENHAAAGFKKIAAGDLGLTSTERFDVSFLLALQMVRTPLHIQGIQQAQNEIARKFIEQGIAAGALQPIPGGFTVESSEDYAVGVAFDGDAIEAVTRILFCRRWSLVEAPTESCGFVLPERPFLMVSAGDRGIYGPGGALHAHQILVPVSRQFLLVMHWEEWTDDPSASVYSLSPSDVQRINVCLCTRSNSKVVFCHPDDTTSVESARRL